jgi:hypothetical protein
MTEPDTLTAAQKAAAMAKLISESAATPTERALTAAQVLHELNVRRDNPYSDGLANGELWKGWVEGFDAARDIVRTLDAERAARAPEGAELREAAVYNAGYAAGRRALADELHVSLTEGLEEASGGDVTRYLAMESEMKAADLDEARCPFCGHREHLADVCEQDLGEFGECQCADTRYREMR